MNKKKYLITYTDGSVSTAAASGILGIKSKKMVEGMSFMAGESIAAADDVLHFEALGISSLQLSKSEMEKLSQNSNILAIEEDKTMYAIGKIDRDEEQFNELFMSSPPIQTQAANASHTDFHKGYDQALVDVFSKLLQTGTPHVNTNGLAIPQSGVMASKQAVPWNISMIKAPTAWKRGITGKGVRLAILDTGISEHEDLKISGGACFVPGVSSFRDGHGHGTHCAGIACGINNKTGIIGVAPDSNLFAVKVLGDDGSGDTSWIIAGMEWCIQNKIQVASMSLGAESEPMVAYANAVKRCQDNGVTVVAASGNSYGNAFPWVCAPANSVIEGQLNASPISVGAVDEYKNVTFFSSRGAKFWPWNAVICVAPGLFITSSYKANSYFTMSGTSMACPHVAGLAALIIQRYPKITAANVKKRIASTSTDLGAKKFDTTYGFGLINCDLATR